MAATATSFGEGLWGISAEETGFLIESVSHNFVNDKKTVKDRTGNDIGVTYYNEQIEVSLNGKFPKTTAFEGTLAAVIALGNTPVAYLKGGITGIIVVENIAVDYNQEEYAAIKLDARCFPSIEAEVAP